MTALRSFLSRLISASRSSPVSDPPIPVRASIILFLRCGGPVAPAMIVRFLVSKANLDRRLLSRLAQLRLKRALHSGAGSVAGRTERRILPRLTQQLTERGLAGLAVQRGVKRR